MKQENSNIQSSKLSVLRDSAMGRMLLCFFYVAASVYIPLCFSVNFGEWLTSVLQLTVCVLTALVLVLIAGSAQTLFGYIFILGLFIILGGALLPAALFSAFAGAICVLSYLILKKSSPIIWGLPLISALIALLVSQTATSAFLALITLPPALMLAHSVKCKFSRIGAVCRISASICLMAAAMFGLFVYSVSGEFTFSAAKGVIESARESLTTLLLTATDEIQQILDVELASVNLDSVIQAAISSVFNLLPAIIIVLGNVLAYIIHSVFLSAYFAEEKDKSRVLPMLTFDMSLTSAVVYITSLVLALVLVSDNLALYGTAAENLMLILAPGLVLTALAGVKALTSRKGPSCLGALAYMLLIFLVASLSPYIIFTVALGGAILIILAHINKRKASSNNS